MSSTRSSRGGLQVIRSIAAVATSLYGTTERYKCVTDRGTSVHLHCVAHLLQNLHILHPVGHLLNDLVQNHHDTYGCGTKTLLMMLDLLAAAAITLKHKGLDEVTIARGLMQAVELSITCLPTLQLSSLFETENYPNEKHTQGIASDGHNDENIAGHQGANDDVWPEVSIGIPQTDHTDQVIANMIKNSLPSSVAVENTDISASGIQFVQLEMRPKQNATGQDDLEEDDVGWFFDDGQVPSDDKMDESIQELLSRAADLLGSADDIEDDEIHGLAGEKKLAIFETISSEHKASPLVVPSKPPVPTFSSLQDNGDEDDFDSCFDTSPKSQHCSTSPHNSLAKEQSNIQLKDELDDEFDSCFDDVSYKATDKNSKFIQPKSLSLEFQGLSNKLLPSDQMKNILNEEKDKIVDVELHEQKGERETLENLFEHASLQHEKGNTSVPNEHLDLNERLKEIMKKKSTSRTANICNQSRHFKTVETTIHEMGSDTADEKQQSLNEKDVDPLSTEILNAKIESIMKSKKALVKEVVLNRSRHYRDISSSVLEMSAENIKHSSANHEGESQSLISNHIPAENQEDACHAKLRTSEATSQSTQIIDTAQSAVPPPPGNAATVTEVKLKSLILGLSRGEDQIAQMVSTAAWQQQGQEGRSIKAVPLSDFRFEVNCLHTVTLVGVSSMKSEVVPGLVIPASLDDLDLLQHPTYRKALLINGDVSPNFQHRGMNNKPDTVLVRKSLATMSREDRWLQNIMRKLEKLSVSALLVKGNVTTEVIDYCHAQGIVVLSHVATKALLAIAETTQSSIATYVAECTKDNIAEGVMIKPWSPDWADQVTCLRHTAYALVTTSAVVVQTAVMCHPCADVAAAMEEKFMHTACRLRNAISSTQIIEGGFEELVAEQLYNVAQEMQLNSSDGPDGDASCMIPVIVEAVAEGFHSLSLVLHANSVVGEFPAMLKHPTIPPKKTKMVPPEHRTVHSLENATNISVTNLDYTVSFDSSAPEIQESSSEHVDGSNDADAYNVEDHFSPAIPAYRRCLYPEEFPYKVVDDYPSRVEAIRCASHLVCQVLQMDYEVVTGLTGAAIPQGDNIIGIL